MNIDKLYDKINEYIKIKLWKDLFCVDVFAIELSDGKIVFISVMGADSGKNWLSLYIEDNINSYLDFIEGKYADDFTEHEITISHNCLQMQLNSKKYLSKEEKDNVNKYNMEHPASKKFKKNFYPILRRLEKNKNPRPITSKKDMEYIYEAMDASIDMKEILYNEDNSIYFNLGEYEAPLLKKKDDKY